MGPILVKQSVLDSQQNIGKRIELISKELVKVNDKLVSIEKEQDKHRENLNQLQQSLNVLTALKS